MSEAGPESRSNPGEQYVQTFLANVAISYSHEQAIKFLDDLTLEDSYWAVVHRGLLIGQRVFDRRGVGMPLSDDEAAEFRGVGLASALIVREFTQRDQLAGRAEPTWRVLLSQVLSVRPDMADPVAYERTGLDLIGDPDKRIEYYI
ncbi:MAG TPA: hypothetical protein VL737_04090 [Candidatus Pristimantibacillus sp.]|nr:hypothetical protein [Candidatus Pristimantibacillus sp.]